MAGATVAICDSSNVLVCTKRLVLFSTNEVCRTRKWIEKSFELNVLLDLLHQKLGLILVAMPIPDETSVLAQQYNDYRGLYELP